MTNLVYADTANAEIAKCPDIVGNKYEAQLREWVDNGFIKGAPDGNFKPNNTITRAEFMALVNRSFGFTETVKINYTDVSKDKWFYNDAAIATKAGYMKGSNGRLIPEDPISRQEFATVLARLTNNEAAADEKVIGGLADGKSIPEWSKAAISTAVNKGYFEGLVDKSFKPVEKITRLEVVVALDRAFKSMYKAVYSKKGTYGPASGMQTLEGSAVIVSADVTLKNTVINGDLILRESIGDGNACLDNVVVKGTTIVKGGGEHSIVVRNSSLGRVIVIREGNIVRIVATGSTTIGEVEMHSGAILKEESLTGKGFGDVVISDDLLAGATVIFEGNFDNIQVYSSNINISVVSGTIGNLTMATGAAGTTVNLSQQAKVVTLNLNAAVKITGQGTIQTVNVNVPGSTIQQQPQNVVTAPGVTVTISNPKPTPTPTTSTGGSGGGGGGNGGGSNTGGDTKVYVTGVTLDKTAMTLKVGGAAGTLVATVSPSNATNKSVIWSSDNKNVVTVSNGIVTPVSAGTAIITATTVDGNKTATCVVTVEKPAPETVYVTGVSLDKTTMTLTARGAAVKLIATVSPSNATNKSINWSSDNKNVATVSNGIVTPIAAGTTTITATTVDGGKTAACVATVEKLAPVVDKDALIAAIAVAQGKADNAKVGSEVGNYPQEAVDALEAAIEAAQAVADNKDATQEEADAAVTALNGAVTDFEAAVIKAPDTYVVTVFSNPANGGEVTVTGAVYNSVKAGDKVTLIATANDVYEFERWTNKDDIEVSTDNPYTFNMPANDIIITANFKAVLAPDKTAPVITLIGEATMRLTVGQIFTDPGVTAIDDVDGDITGKVEVAGKVDTNTPGTYVITYNVKDAAGNAAVGVTRTITVSEDPKPAAIAAAISAIGALPEASAITLADKTAAEAARALVEAAKLKGAVEADITNLARLIAVETKIIVLSDAEAIVIGYAAGDSAESVTHDLVLPIQGALGSQISWRSSNYAVIKHAIPFSPNDNGKVSRPIEDTVVTLTATVVKGKVIVDRDFTVTVKGDSTTADAVAVTNDADALEIGYAAGESAASVKNNLTLSSTGANGSTIMWSSSAEETIIGHVTPFNQSSLGKVTRPQKPESDKKVTLTATITKGGASKTKTFAVTVLAYPTDQEAAEAAAEAIEIVYAAGDNAESVTQKVTLPQIGLYNTTIAWESSNEGVLVGRVTPFDQQRLGNVTRLKNDTTITLTATVYKGQTTAKRSFTVIVKGDTDSEYEAKLQADVDALAIGFANGEDKDGVKSNLKLPQYGGVNGSMILWKSSAEETIVCHVTPFNQSSLGKVTRPMRPEPDKKVTLTATLTFGPVTATKTFTVTVLAYPTDQEAAEADASAIVIGYAEGDSAVSVTHDLTLPTQGAMGSQISWRSSNYAVIKHATPFSPNDNGKVSRPIEDTQVTLTATIVKGTVILDRDFLVTVKGDNTSPDAIAVEADCNALEIGYAAGDSAASVKKNLTLSTVGSANGSYITWKSSDTIVIGDVISPFGGTLGRVTRPQKPNNDKVVTLTATITKGGASKTKVFSITVLAYPTDQEVADEVNLKIASLPEASEITLANKADVEAVRAVYEALTEEQKSLVTNLSVLSAAEAKIQELEYAELKAEVESKVAEYEGLANGDLTTQELIDAAKASKAAISLEGLTGDDKTAFNARISEADQKVAAAQASIDSKAAAEAAVKAVEGLVNTGLGTQDKINAAQAALTAARSLVNALEQSAAKNELSARLNTAQNAINAAQDKLDVETVKSGLTLTVTNPTGTNPTISLPTNVKGTAITWTEQEDGSNLISINNNVVYITKSSSNTKTAKIEATIKKGNAAEYKTFTITIPKNGAVTVQ